MRAVASPDGDASWALAAELRHCIVVELEGIGAVLNAVVEAMRMEPEKGEGALA